MTDLIYPASAAGLLIVLYFLRKLIITSKKPDPDLAPPDWAYCKKHDRWYARIYGDGCEECLTEAKNEN